MYDIQKGDDIYKAHPNPKKNIKNEKVSFTKKFCCKKLGVSFYALK